MKYISIKKENKKHNNECNETKQYIYIFFEIFLFQLEIYKI